MAENDKLHRKFAVDCFNDTWDLIEKTDRTNAENMRMIHMAHASRFHWAAVGTPLNFARGDWQISRVYSILGQGQNALTYAKNSLNLCLENEIGDFDLAFAYEAMARAYDVIGDRNMKKEYMAKATQASQAISKEADRNYILDELASINPD